MKVANVATKYQKTNKMDLAYNYTSYTNCKLC